ncbi:MAG: hypothetical protein NT159_08255 [Proteobacteria bacterium]|nr:hypothetical protein [Pseudomonadota bacterium]
MVYSEVVRGGLILPKKLKYTVADVENVMVNSLFTPTGSGTLAKHAAAFIVKCSAIFHGTDHSKAVGAIRPR